MSRSYLDKKKQKKHVKAFTVAPPNTLCYLLIWG